MPIILLLLFISPVKLHFVNIVKRDVQTSSLQNLNRYIKTYEIGQNIVFNPPNFTLIDSLLFIHPTNQPKSSVRQHTSWYIRQISSNQSQQLAQYNSIEQQFIINQNKHNPFTIHPTTGQLTLINTNHSDLLSTEVSLHVQTGLRQGDDILYDIYRFVRLLPTSINCTRNLIVNRDELFEIDCTIEYEFYQYDDLGYYQPRINLTLYKKGNNSLYRSVNEIYLNEIKDFQIDRNKTLNWKRLISYKIQSEKQDEEEYVCIITSDSLQNQDNNRICRTQVTVRNNHSSTVIFSRINQLDLIDILMIILIIFSILLFITSSILCITARQYHIKRTVQIKPDNKPMMLPMSSNQTSSNNNEIKSEVFSQRLHKPGCPKYLPPSEYNLLSDDLFTHTTIDNIKKIILPDITETTTTDLFNDQTYIHFYIPSKTENRFPSSFFEKEKLLN